MSKYIKIIGYELIETQPPRCWSIPKNKDYCEKCNEEDIPELKKQGTKIIWDCGYAIYKKKES